MMGCVLQSNIPTVHLCCVSPGDCDAGYYCPGGDSVPNPAATICTVGHYCPQGSPSPTPCPAGTYSNSLGLTQESDCQNCTAGIK